MPEFDKHENKAAADSGAAAENISASEGDTDGGFDLVYMTFPSMSIAETVGNELVSDGLAACVNIIPGMVSIYHWRGERHRDSEVVMIVKTRRILAAAVIARTRTRHPYENPAMLVLPVTGGARAFLDWIATQTTPHGKTGG